MIKSLNDLFIPPHTPYNYNLAAGTPPPGPALEAELRTNGLTLTYDPTTFAYTLTGSPLPGIEIKHIVTDMELAATKVAARVYIREVIRDVVRRSLTGIGPISHFPPAAIRVVEGLIRVGVQPAAGAHAAYRALSRWITADSANPRSGPPSTVLAGLAWRLPGPLLAGIRGIGECSDAYGLGGSLLLMLPCNKLVSAKLDALLNDDALQVRLALMADELATAEEANIQRLQLGQKSALKATLAASTYRPSLSQKNTP